MVGLGMDVSVNFIISNAWLKQIGAVMDYGMNALNIPLHSDMKRFEVTYHHTQINCCLLCQLMDLTIDMVRSTHQFRRIII